MTSKNDNTDNIQENTNHTEETTPPRDTNGTNAPGNEEPQNLYDEEQDRDEQDHKENGLVAKWNELTQGQKLALIGAGAATFLIVVAIAANIGDNDKGNEPAGSSGTPQIGTVTKDRPADDNEADSPAGGKAKNNRQEEPSNQGEDNSNDEDEAVNPDPNEQNKSGKTNREREQEIKDAYPGGGDFEKQYLYGDEIPGNINNAATTIREKMADHTPNKLNAYDDLADALEADGLVPDESVYEAFENAGYIGDSGDTLMQSAAGDPQIFDNGDGTYTISYPVVATVMSRDVMNTMGWTNHQRQLYKSLEEQLNNGENVRRLNYTVDPESGRVSIEDTAWWL